MPISISLGDKYEDSPPKVNYCEQYINDFTVLVKSGLFSPLTTYPWIKRVCWNE